MKKKWIIACSILAVVVIAAGIFFYVRANEKKEVPYVMNFEQIIKADRAYMQETFGNDTTILAHFEADVIMNEWLDDSTSTGEFNELVDIFEVITHCHDGGSIVNVYAIQHFYPDSVNIKPAEDAFWIEDHDLYESYDFSQITFNEAYMILVSQDSVKLPHSKYCVLRQTVGPDKCNPQFIFGNKVYRLFIDSYTGDLNRKDPSGLPDQPELYFEN